MRFDEADREYTERVGGALPMVPGALQFAVKFSGELWGPDPVPALDVWQDDGPVLPAALEIRGAVLSSAPGVLTWLMDPAGEELVAVVSTTDAWLAARAADAHAAPYATAYYGCRVQRCTVLGNGAVDLTLLFRRFQKIV